MKRAVKGLLHGSDKGALTSSKIQRASKFVFELDVNRKLDIPGTRLKAPLLLDLLSLGINESLECSSFCVITPENRHLDLHTKAF